MKDARGIHFFFLESETNTIVAVESAFPISGIEENAEFAGQ